MIAVNDEIAPAVGAGVDRVLDDFDAAEMRAVIFAQELVVIARHVDDARALARLAQQFLHDVVMRLRPVPARAELPAIDDVADEVDVVGIVVAQETQEPVGLAAARAKMHIGNETACGICFGSAVTLPNIVFPPVG